MRLAPKYTTKPVAILAMASLTIALSGCATVDFKEMSTPAVSAGQAKGDVNIVKRAAERLSAAFRTRGFVAKTSRKKMHSAAQVLLNGIHNANALDSSETGYQADAKPRDVVIADMVYAKGHVDRAKDAAEIYLAMVPEQHDLTVELTALENALLAARQATSTFETALKGTSAVELDELEASVDRLRDVTDEFGHRVRVSNSNSLAVQAASEVG